MSVLTRPAVLLATTAMAAGLVAAPGAAYAADTTTTLTAAEMKAALQQVATASAAAGDRGWKATVTYSGALFGGSTGATETIVLDALHGLYSDSFTMKGHPTVQSFAADGRGFYEQVGTSRERAALKMMGRPAVKYTFKADKSLDLDEFAPGPETVVTADDQEGGSRTTHDDGSVDYTLTEAIDGTTSELTLNVSAAGVLTGLSADFSGDGETAGMDLAYTYGPQTVTLPSSSATVAANTLYSGVAYLDMATVVKRAATAGAADARKAAKGGKVKVTSLRKVVSRDVAAANRNVKLSMVKTRSITGGVRVYATNPWTKKTVAYTVKASGRKVVLKKV